MPVKRYRVWPCLDGAELQEHNEGSLVAHADYSAIEQLTVDAVRALKRVRVVSVSINPKDYFDTVAQIKSVLDRAIDIGLEQR